MPKCEKCTKYGNNNSEMNKIKLEPKQIKEKMVYAKMQGYPYTFVYIAYDYFECPICHWFKFMKKKYIKSVNIEGFNT